MLRSNQQDDKWESTAEHDQSSDHRAESRTGSAITGEAPARRPGGYTTNVRVDHFLFLFVIGLSTLAGAGCGSSCPVDADGDGTITEEELRAFTPPSDPAELVGLFLGCQSLLEQLGLNSAEQLGSTSAEQMGSTSPEQLDSTSPEQTGLNWPTIIDMPADRTVNDGEVFVVDASQMISGEGEVDLRDLTPSPSWSAFAVNRVGPLRWEVTAPLLEDNAETITETLEFSYTDPNNCNPPELSCRTIMGSFRVTVLNTDFAADRLSGWWGFGTCSTACSLQFRFDGSGTLVDARGHVFSNDPEVFIPQLQDMSFSGSISESGVSFEFSGRYWQPRWRNVQELERDPSSNLSRIVLDSLLPGEKQDIVRRVGTMWHKTISFETSREPPLSREGPTFGRSTTQDTHVLVVCDSNGCRISRYYEDVVQEWNDRVWARIGKYEYVAP